MSRVGREGLALALVALVALLAPAGTPAATIDVDTPNDDKPVAADNSLCSLREAIEAAGTNSPVDTCDQGETTLDTINLPVGTYSLSGTTGEDANAGGDLDANVGSGGMTIDGAGASSTTITTSVADRILDLRSGAGTLTLEGVKITGGNVSGNGGGIEALGGTHLTVANSTVTTNNANLNGATGAGGGIFASNPVELVIQDSTVSDNDAFGTFGGGGVYALGGIGLQMSGSTVSGNESHGTGPAATGGGINLGAPATITGSTVSGNSVAAVSSSGGGGIYSAAGGPADLTIGDSTISGNHADSGSGGGLEFTDTGVRTLSVTGTDVTGNTAADTGGGILATDKNATVNLTGSQVNGNALAGASASAHVGGGIFTSADTTTLTASTVAGNTINSSNPAASLQGGGVSAGIGNPGEETELHLIGSTVSGNQLGATPALRAGGGVRLTADTGGLLAVRNSTISGNVAGVAGGIDVSTAPARIAHATVAANTAASATALRATNTAVTTRNSIFADGAAACSTASGGSIVSADYNFDRGSSCLPAPLAHDLTAIDPVLGALASNGGPTQTMALPATSPALDRIPAASCTDEQGAALGIDQRAQPRPAGLGCDVGAYEFQPPVPESAPNLPTSSGSNLKCFGQKVTIHGTGRSEVLAGTAGNDVIATMGGADKVNAGPGTDVVCGGPGRDRLKGGAGGDTLLGQGGRDTLLGGGGMDLLNAGAGRKEICNGGGGKDVAKGCESKRRIP